MACKRKGFHGSDVIPSCFRPRPITDENVQSANSREMVFKFSEYETDTFRTFASLRESDKLCDVDLVVDKVIFRCHKLVLAAASPYFRAMFTSGLIESSMDKINLQGVDPESVSSLIDFCYTGEIIVKEMTVCQLLPVATMFQINYAIDACSTYLENQLAPVNCFGISEFALHHGCKSLHLKCQAYIHQHFAQVCREEEFLNLSEAKLINLIKCDELNVPCESIVYDAVIRWIEYDKPRRLPKVKEILSLVRLYFVPPDFIRRQLADCKVIKDATTCRNYLSKIFRDLSIHIKPSVEPRNPHTPTVVYIAGGYLSKSLDNLDLFIPVEQQYYSLEPMLKPRSGLGSGFLYDKFHVIGGRNNNPEGNQDSSSVDCYDLFTNSWQTCQPMNVPRNRVGVGVMDQMLYAIGGSDGKIHHKSVERFCSTRNDWSWVSSMHTARIGVGVAVVNRLMYVIGGFDGENRLNSVERYHPEKNEWQFVTSMETRRSGCGVAAIDLYIYAIGGYDGRFQLKTVERYNTELDKWEYVASMNSPRSALSVVNVNGKLYAFGGYNGQEFLSSVEVYDASKNIWTDETAMVCGRSGHTAAVYTAPCIFHQDEANTCL